MPWSTSVGREECYSSMLCISPLNSSMKALALAAQRREEALAAGRVNQARWLPFNAVFPPRENKSRLV